MDDFANLTIESWDTGAWSTSASGVSAAGSLTITTSSVAERYAEWSQGSGPAKAWDAEGTTATLWLKVDNLPTNSGTPAKKCRAAISTDGSSYTSAIIGSTGVVGLSLSPTPALPSPIKKIRIHCEAGSGWSGGALEIDWFVLGDSSTAVLPPTSELLATWSFPRFSGGGVTSTVIARGWQNQVWVGSDVGGIGRSVSTPHAFDPRNGNPATGSLGRTWDYAVWGLNPVSNSDVFALTGDLPYGNGTDYTSAEDEDWSLRGGLWVSHNNGTSWSIVAENNIDLDDPLFLPLAASGRTNEYATEGQEVDSSIAQDFSVGVGKLILWKMDSTYNPAQPTTADDHRVIYAASHLRQDNGIRTLYAMATDADEPSDLCAPYGYPDTSETWDDHGLPDGIISALLPTFPESYAAGAILVGMKRGPNSGVYVCDPIDVADLGVCDPHVLVVATSATDALEKALNNDSSLPDHADATAGPYLLERIHTSDDDPPVESWNATPIGLTNNPSLSSYLVRQGTEDLSSAGDSSFMVAATGQGAFQLDVDW